MTYEELRKQVEVVLHACGIHGGLFTATTDYLLALVEGAGGLRADAEDIVRSAMEAEDQRLRYDLSYTELARVAVSALRSSPPPTGEAGAPKSWALVDYPGSPSHSPVTVVPDAPPAETGLRELLAQADESLRHCDKRFKASGYAGSPLAAKIRAALALPEKGEGQ